MWICTILTSSSSFSFLLDGVAMADHLFPSYPVFCHNVQTASPLLQHWEISSFCLPSFFFPFLAATSSILLPMYSQSKQSPSTIPTTRLHNNCDLTNYSPMWGKLPRFFSYKNSLILNFVRYTTAQHNKAQLHVQLLIHNVSETWRTAD